ncbi:MAG: flagellar assembly peptidoglycan hydrolase FlgJ [Burkholderiales bacterium]|uniref:flagellar assembly peptidoglycan hydrolase FlgJ n=1 Tax=Inhella sp. TaxID=1921806 RepID=UPI001AC4C185|nr:flagellar assembly peptidoglycan hydrolase FlgJ [Burkholderiales bacterium]
MNGLNGLAADAKNLESLKGRAARDPQAATKEAARQFEALFMQEVMKRMRAASLDTGLMDNEMTQLGTEMLDQQYAQAMAGLPGGLSAAIERQLSGGLRPSTGDNPLSMRGKLGDARVSNTEPLPQLAKKNVPEHAARFIRQHDEAAKQVAAESGIPAAFMLAQAAHETGWGRAGMKGTDGLPANNLFGIKAGKGWTGRVAEVTTTEYVNGAPRKVVARFRAYDSAEDSFRDYAKLISGNRRYAAAFEAAQAAQAAQTAQATQLAQAGTGASQASAQHFARHLQRAGYATDPEYANKLGRVINTTLRVQRALA